MKTGVGSLQRPPSHRREGPTPMPHRVSPTDRIRGHIDELFAQDKALPEILEEDARLGSRNGYREVTVKTTAGPVTLARPKLRGTTEAFASRLFGSHVTKTN